MTAAYVYTTHRGKRVSPAHAVLLAAFERAHGLLYVNQGARTIGEQAAFYATYLRVGYPLAARPWGGAPHIKWGAAHHALDVNAGPAHALAAFYRARGVPVAFNVPGEPWHMDTLDLAALARAAATIAPPAFPTIRKGSHGAAVQKLQVYLRAAGYLPARWHVHQSYTLYVRRAVRRAQRDHLVPVDGIVGAKTWRALGARP